MLCLPARCDRTIGILLSLTFASTLLHAEDLVFDIDPLRSELVNILFISPLGVDAHMVEALWQIAATGSCHCA